MLKQLSKSALVGMCLILSGCAQQVDLNSLKEQVRKELQAEIRPSAAPASGAAPAASPSASGNPAPSPSPTPVATPTPYQLSERVRERAELAVDELQELRSRLKVGMNFRDFTTAVGDAKVAVDRFTSVTDAKRHPSYPAIRLAMQRYELASDVWDCHFDLDGTNSFAPYSCFGATLSRDYDVDIVDIGGQKFFLDTALSKIWTKGGEAVSEAEGVLEAAAIEPQAETAPGSAASASAEPVVVSRPVVIVEKALVTGHVDDFNGVPLSGAAIRVYYLCKENPSNYEVFDKTVLTNADGNYLIQAPVGFQLLIDVSKDGYYPRRRLEIPEADSQNKYDFMQITDEIDVSLYPKTGPQPPEFGTINVPEGCPIQKID